MCFELMFPDASSRHIALAHWASLLGDDSIKLAALSEYLCIMTQGRLQLMSIESGMSLLSSTIQSAWQVLNLVRSGRCVSMKIISRSVTGTGLFSQAFLAIWTTKMAQYSVDKLATAADKTQKAPEGLIANIQPVLISYQLAPTGQSYVCRSCTAAPRRVPA